MTCSAEPAGRVQNKHCLVLTTAVRMAILSRGFWVRALGAVDCGKVASATGKTCAERSEVFRSSGNRGAGIGRRMAVGCYERAGETLASKKSAKATERCLLSMTYIKPYYLDVISVQDPR